MVYLNGYVLISLKILHSGIKERHLEPGWERSLFMFPQRVSAFEMQASTCVDLVSIHMALLRANTEN